MRQRDMTYFRTLLDIGKGKEALKIKFLCHSSLVHLELGLFMNWKMIIDIKFTSTQCLVEPDLQEYV